MSKMQQLMTIGDVPAVIRGLPYESTTTLLEKYAFSNKLVLSNHQTDCSKDVNVRIAMRYEECAKDQSIPVALKMRLVKTLVRAMLSYRAEVWILAAEDTR